MVKAINLQFYQVGNLRHASQRSVRDLQTVLCSEGGRKWEGPFACTALRRIKHLISPRPTRFSRNQALLLKFAFRFYWNFSLQLIEFKEKKLKKKRWKSVPKCSVMEAKPQAGKNFKNFHIFCVWILSNSSSMAISNAIYLYSKTLIRAVIYWICLF